jgi:hypothetical protein
VKRALKAENAYVRETSERLTYQREHWKERREAIVRNGGNKEAIRVLSFNSSLSTHLHLFLFSASLSLCLCLSLSAQAEGHELNEQTNQLNELMKQIKKTQLWLSEREKKLFRWEQLMNEKYSTGLLILPSSPLPPGLTVSHSGPSLAISSLLFE